MIHFYGQITWTWMDIGFYWKRKHRINKMFNYKMHRPTCKQCQKLIVYMYWGIFTLIISKPLKLLNIPVITANLAAACRGVSSSVSLNLNMLSRPFDFMMCTIKGTNHDPTSFIFPIFCCIRNVNKQLKDIVLKSASLAIPLASDSRWKHSIKYNIE